MSCPVKVKICSQCLGDTEFYCQDCEDNLCWDCKDSHVANLDTKHHYVMLYREKMNFMQKRKCVQHENKFYDTFCKKCEIPICFQCRKHRKHDKQDIIEAYRIKREEQRPEISQIRFEKLYNACALRASLKTDVRIDMPNCHRKFHLIFQGMELESHRLLNLFNDKEFQDDIWNLCKGRVTSKINEQIKIMKRNIAKITAYEHKHNLSSNRPVKFFRFIKEHRFSQIQNKLKTTKQCEYSVQENYDLKTVMSSLSKIKRSNRRTRHPKKENLLKMCSPVIQTYVTIDDIESCCHISFSTTDKFWISSGSDLILTDKTGKTLHYISNLHDVLSGVHTVNEKWELIYIADDLSIKKMSSDMEKNDNVLKLENSPWKALCLHYSQLTGNFLVAMKKNGSTLCKIVLYNTNWKHVNTLRQRESDSNLYKNPIFITENNNGDVAVSDSENSAVVVTDRRGAHRYTYTGPQSESGLDPRGICCDALSNVLVCDIKTNTVQIIDEDGNYLSNLLGESRGISEPVSLSYDPHNHFVWVGSLVDNTVSVYRYLNRYPDWEGMSILKSLISPKPSLF